MVLSTSRSTGSAGHVADHNTVHAAINALPINVQSYGAVGDGIVDDTAAIQAAINAASSAGGGEVRLAPGTYKATASLALKSRVHLVGAGRTVTTIKPTAAVTTAVLLGSSGDTVTDARLSHFTIDAQYSVTAQSIHGIQITNGSKVTIDSLGVVDVGVAGILLQGLGSGGGTPNSVVRNCLIDGTGLVDGTTGFGVHIKDASSNCQVIDNIVLNVKGGMGIGMSGSGGTGFPTFGTIARNTIDMQNSTTSFEAIGITAGCTNTNIADNNIIHSYDNGISVSAADCVVVGNNIDMCFNHGIGSAGNYNVITGNRIHNPGQQDAAAYGGIALTSTTGNIVVGNVIYDGQGTPTMSHGVKFNTSSGGNQIGSNYISGALLSPIVGATITDVIPSADPPGWGICTNIGAPTVASSGQTFPTTNQVNYYRLVGGGGPITKARVRINTQSGNLAIAYYSNSGSGLSAAPGAYLGGSGITACAAPGSQDLTLSATVTPNAGDWVAIWADNTTISINGTTGTTVSSSTQAGRAYFQTGQAGGPPTSAPAGVAAGVHKMFDIIGVP